MDMKNVWRDDKPAERDNPQNSLIMNLSVIGYYRCQDYGGELIMELCDKKAIELIGLLKRGK
jgi:hypothetical protein